VALVILHKKCMQRVLSLLQWQLGADHLTLTAHARTPLSTALLGAEPWGGGLALLAGKQEVCGRQECPVTHRYLGRQQKQPAAHAFM
jgi:hypothetical protein